MHNTCALLTPYAEPNTFQLYHYHAKSAALDRRNVSRTSWGLRTPASSLEQQRVPHHRISAGVAGCANKGCSTEIGSEIERELEAEMRPEQARSRVVGSRKAEGQVLTPSGFVTIISEFKGEKRSLTGYHKLHGRNTEGRSIQVLLLLIQHGANGLNLLEAKHVILIEPLLNPAVEAQAISRVHRIGQTNKTLAHRFIVKGTVEESIYNLNKGRNSAAFISGNTKNHDQPLLTLKDIEALFSTVPSLPVPETDERPTDSESLRHLPPSVAAAIAAEKRLMEQHS